MLLRYPCAGSQGTDAEGVATRSDAPTLWVWTHDGAGHVVNDSSRIAGCYLSSPTVELVRRVRLGLTEGVDAVDQINVEIPDVHELAYAVDEGGVPGLLIR